MEIENLKQLIQELNNAFAHDEVDIDLVQHIMASYKSNAAEWKQYAKFDRYKYTRNLVDEGNGKFNLMMLCWGPSQMSTIHDHTDAHCVMKMLKGSLQETRYEWPAECIADDVVMDEKHFMKEIGSSLLKKNGVLYINDAMGLHRVENPSHTDGAVSLHLYSPPFDHCQCFDERTGKRMECRVTFYSKYGQKVNNDNAI